MTARKDNSTNKFNEEIILNYCNTMYSIFKIGGRWKMMILCELKSGKLRFGELKKCIPNITERMLTLQIRELEKDLLVKRTVYAEVPPRVDYQLSEIAVKLIPIWDMLDIWGAEHRFLISQKEAEL